ncbi:hypothetical protein SETIT_5G127700v2 [Setaria italica]|uniref:Uncharacterized protein n=1 Tax=Setaria italica TaxID=4555 RepID=A0A368R483_SETIT|nr:hypothetical protein SETIT_5G127700v2 [Setaria italica]
MCSIFFSPLQEIIHLGALLPTLKGTGGRSLYGTVDHEIPSSPTPRNDDKLDRDKLLLSSGSPSPSADRANGMGRRPALGAWDSF